MTKTPESDFQTNAPSIFLALASIHTLIDNCGLDRNLSNLIMLRASQINRCGYCVEMHTREAREDGESNERLDLVVVFDQSKHFSEKEALALEWTEKLTSLKSDTDYGDIKKKLLKHYTPKELAAMAALIGMINTWNRIRISEH